MCGIAGILQFNGAPVQSDLVAAVTRRLAHRGPDGESVLTQGPVGFGHRRLAIIDLEGGRQPMQDAAGECWLVANGEIYNYRELRAELRVLGHQFLSNGDCETILHGYRQWGASVVERLRGMFAFAIWDKRRQQLLLGRDRVGIKPLCYLHSGSRFAFASEIQALKVLPEFDGSVDLAAIDQFLHLQYIPAPGSGYRQIRKLAPGHTLLVNADGRVDAPRRYWKFRFDESDPLPECECVEALDAALADAVRSHLVADVPFGAFLSGGVDSSTVVAYAARELDQRLRTFSVGFDVASHDERAYARQVAAIVGTSHQEQVLDLDALALLPKLVHHYGEPFADSSAVCTWRVCEAARREVPMVLSGDGGDEVFAGYSYFSKLVDQYQLPGGALRGVRRQIGNLARSVGVLRALPDVADAWYDRSPFFPDSVRRQLWRAPNRQLPDATRAWNASLFSQMQGRSVLNRCQQVDIESYLAFDNLAKVDIASMAHGLEVRVPLLDHHLLETAARIPTTMRLHASSVNPSGYSGKYALKLAASKFLPMALLERPKMGFSVPLGDWLGGQSLPWIRERLLGPRSVLGDWFDSNLIASWLAEHGHVADHGHRLWALLVLAEWAQPTT